MSEPPPSESSTDSNNPSQRSKNLVSQAVKRASLTVACFEGLVKERGKALGKLNFQLGGPMVRPVSVRQAPVPEEPSSPTFASTSSTSHSSSSASSSSSSGTSLASIAFSPPSSSASSTPMPAVVPKPVETSKASSGKSEENAGHMSVRAQPPARQSMPRTSTLLDWTKSGFLEKRKLNERSWKRRFFLLKDSLLFYLKTGKDARPLGCIDLLESGMRVLAALDFFSETGDISTKESVTAERQRTLIVVTAKKTWEIKASNAEEAQDWLKTLRLAKVTGPSFGPALGGALNGLQEAVKKSHAGGSGVEGKEGEEKEKEQVEGGPTNLGGHASLQKPLFKRKPMSHSARLAPPVFDDLSSASSSSSLSNSSSVSLSSSSAPLSPSASVSPVSASSSSSSSTSSSSPSSSSSSSSFSAPSAPSAPSTGPTRPHSGSVGEQHCLQLLTKGGVFLKYKKFRSTVKRFIWCSNDLLTLYWGPPPPEGGPASYVRVPKNSVAIKELRQVQQGSEGGRDKDRDARSITLMFESRVLDLEANSVEECDKWFEAFSVLLFARAT